MFHKQNQNTFIPVLQGIQRTTLAYGKQVLMTEFSLRKGSALPVHAHPHEQIGYLLKGRMRLLIGAQEFLAEPGDSWCIPSGVEHSARILEESLAIEVFSPVRQDYLPTDNA